MGILNKFVSVDDQVALANELLGLNFKQSTLPWFEERKDSFFGPAELMPERVDGIYPYRLLVVDVRFGNSIVNGFFDAIDVTKYKSDTGGIQYSFDENAHFSWEFILPITPQQLSITDQFAINTSATMRGVVEEHNGVKFKMISASGTTGIWPSRGKIIVPDKIPFLDTFFAETSAAATAIAKAAKRLINGGNTPPDGASTSVDFHPMADNGGTNTGYFQAQLLQQFLEQYSMAKKDPNNKHWRLVFDCPKTNESFVVTPVTFTNTKSQRSPGETLFNMQFKAWKRIKLNSLLFQTDSNIESIDVNFLQTLVNGLDNARSLMSSLTNIIKAVRADFRKPFDLLRKVTLLAKDIGGFAFAVSDLPNQIGKDISSATKKRSADLAQSERLFAAAFGGRSDNTTTSQKKIRGAISSIKSNNNKNEGVSDEDIEAGQLGVEARDANRASPVNDVFDNPEENFDFNAGTPISELDLTPKQQAAIQDEIELNSLLSIEEVKDITVEIQNLILDLTNNFGAGSAFFSKTFNRPPPKERAVPMSIEEFQLITALEEAVLKLHILTATRQFDDDRTQSPLEYVGGLADDSGIEFDQSSTSKILTPVPFGLTIQQISARLLKDPDRYNEIITLNNLRSPYIDEDGFFYALLTNGDDRQLSIGSDENLFIGQKIQLSSNVINMFTRKISAIEKIADGNYLVTVDGLGNLSSLKTSDNAKIKAFLPGTTNSQNQIYIPSKQALPPEARTFDIPYLKGDTLTGLSKIDWLLQDDGDLVINSFGEVNLANGINNIMQALKMEIVTEKGWLLSNTNYGLNMRIGANVTDLVVENVLKDLRAMILQDSRFEGVDSIEMNILPPTISLTIQARLANGRGVFPINLTI